jgi:hypothetical protein
MTIRAHRVTKPHKNTQQPLASPRGRSPHNFTQSLPDWEAAVFDSATLFVVQYLRRPTNERRFEFCTMQEAVDHARSQDDPACLYAVSESGRFALLSREKWDEWLARASN